MKITAEHADHIRQAILTKAHLAAAHRQSLASDSRVKDIDKRLRWDLLYASVQSRWICDTIYPYANDTHLDTLLRHIMQEINS